MFHIRVRESNVQLLAIISTFQMVTVMLTMMIIKSKSKAMPVTGRGDL
jgi:hypothetical protein